MVKQITWEAKADKTFEEIAAYLQDEYSNKVDIFNTRQDPKMRKY